MNLDPHKQQTIDIATRLMESWMRSFWHDTMRTGEREAKQMAKTCVRAAKAIQQEALCPEKD